MGRGDGKTSSILVSRARVGVYRGADGIDITAKSASGIAKSFAPPWEMVVGSRAGKLPWEEYEELYLRQLNSLSPEYWTWLRQAGSRTGKLVLLCYCSPSSPSCHCQILLRWLLEHEPVVYRVW